MKPKTNLLFLLMLICITTSCNKLTMSDGDPCYNYRHITVTSNSPVTIGQTINFRTQEVGGDRIYSWTGPDNYSGESPTNTIYYAEPANEGWYYLNLSS